MAIGEAACVSVHGANRLGSNSLIDLVVFGKSAAKRAAELVKPNSPHDEISKSETDKSLDRFDKLRNGNGSNKTSELRLSMQKTMQAKCAVFRTEKTLKEGVEDERINFLDKLVKKIPNIKYDFYGFSNKQPIWGNDFNNAIINSKMGLFVRNAP